MLRAALQAVLGIAKHVLRPVHDFVDCVGEDEPETNVQVRGLFDKVLLFHPYQPQRVVCVSGCGVGGGGLANRECGKRD